MTCAAASSSEPGRKVKIRLTGHVHFLQGLVIGLVLAGLYAAVVRPPVPKELPLARPFDLLRALDSGGLPTLRVPSAPIPRLVRDRVSLPIGATGLSLTRLEWAYGASGWPALPEVGGPAIDVSVAGGPMKVAGVGFNHGIGTYPFSEIVYDLRRRGLSFTTGAGITDDSRNGAGSVRFFIYGDEFLLYESGTVRVGDQARSVMLDLRGFSQLRLIVDDAGDGSLGDYALWAEPVLFLSSSGDRAALDSMQTARARQAGVERAARVAESRAVRARRDLDSGALERLGSSADGATGRFDELTSGLLLANDRIAVVLGYGGQRNGHLSLIRRTDDFPILQDVSPTLETRDGRKLALATQRPADPVELRFERIVRQGQRPGIETAAIFSEQNGSGKIVVHIALFDADSEFEVRITTEGIPLKSIQYLAPDEGAAFLGRNVYYLAGSVGGSKVRVHADGHTRRTLIGEANPAILWSEVSGQGLVFSTPESRSSPFWLSARRHPGRAGTELGIELQASPNDFGLAQSVTPPLSIKLMNGKPGS